MFRSWGFAIAAAVAFASAAASAQDPLPAEELKVETNLKPGPNVFVVTSGWAGASTVNIFSAADLTYKGNFSAGLNTQFFVGGAGATGYTASAYPKRIFRGPTEAVLERFDVSTLMSSREIVILPKFAQTQAAHGMLQVSADSAWAFVQNATPATSVSVVDLKTGKLAAEVPNPGCWTTNLSADGSRFSSLCGDGRILTVKLGPSGKPVSQAFSDKIFDVEKDPLFTHAQRVDGDLVFVSYSGVLYRVSDTADVARLVDTFAFAPGVAGTWAPGGYEVMGYNAPTGVMFVGMHSGAKNGSHKNGSEEIWAIDLNKKAVLYRSVAKGLTHLTVTQDPLPVIFGVNSHGAGLYRFEVDPTARFAAKLTHQIGLENASYVLAP
jgi:methylamine dehydrogenase heavy chain